MLIENLALSVSNLNYNFGSKFALKNINFSIELGQFKVLLGPNGAGKTTLLSLITNLFGVKTNEIKIGNFDLSKNPMEALKKIGVVFQQSTLDLDLTVKQNLLYHSSLYGLEKKFALNRIKIELQRLNMFERQDEKIRYLNGGHRRRVEIARALLHQPLILLLDEPTVGLDVPTRRQIVEHIHSLAKENHTAVLWTTHLIDEVFNEDHVIILNNGEICVDGPVSEVLTSFKEDSITTIFDNLTGKLKS